MTIYFLIHYSHKKSIFMDCHESNKPQRLHSVPTPRIGGIGIFLASSPFVFYIFGSVVFLASVIVFASGILEDFTGRVTQKQRLLLQSIGAAVFVIGGHYTIKTIGMGFEFPYWFAVMFTIFAIVGVINSINIIDGLNGLASGVALFAFIFFSTVANLSVYNSLTLFCMVDMAAIVGFLLFNFPKGRIFLGDGGAYFLGFMLAIVSVGLVDKNENISAWFCLAVLIYPIWEVLFSIFRRKFGVHKKAMGADKMHLHQVVMRTLKLSNPKAALVIVFAFLPFQLLSILFYNKGAILFVIIVTFIVFYQLTYIYLTKITNIKKHQSKE